MRWPSQLSAKHGSSASIPCLWTRGRSGLRLRMAIDLFKTLKLPKRNPQARTGTHTHTHALWHLQGEKEASTTALKKQRQATKQARSIKDTTKSNKKKQRCFSGDFGHLRPGRSQLGTSSEASALRRQVPAPGVAGEAQGLGNREGAPWKARRLWRIQRMMLTMLTSYGSERCAKIARW